VSKAQTRKRLALLSSSDNVRRLEKQRSLAIARGTLKRKAAESEKPTESNPTLSGSYAADPVPAFTSDNGWSSPRIVGSSSETVGWMCMARCNVV
jgi:hypothetical protein